MTRQEMDQEPDSHFFTVSRLKSEGFTEALIRDLLGEPDRYRPNKVVPGAAPKRMYHESRVRAAQRSVEFQGRRILSLARQAERIGSDEAAASNPIVFRGVPTFFRARCAEAKRGGTDGYYWVGHNFAKGCAGMVEGETEDEVEAKLLELDQLLTAAAKSGMDPSPADPAVLTWFDSEFPRCMELVPARRRSSFVRGVREAHETYEITRL